MEELDDKTYAQIQELCAAGDRFADQSDFSSALENYWNAFDLVPEPKTAWDTTTWILTAIGDANFLGNDFRAGVDNLSNAMHCPGAIGNLDRAADELTRAYAVNGEEIFSEEDPKYLEFLKTRIDTNPPKKKSWWKR